MSRQFKDLIREFKTGRREEAPLPVAAPEPEPPPPDDGPAVAAMTEFLDAVAALSQLMEEETAAIAAGDMAGLDGFAQRKLVMADRLEGLTARFREAAPALGGDLRALTLERIERLDRAVAGNAAGLLAIRKAVLTINRNLLAALEKAESDGLYAPSGQSVRPVELSASGLNTEL